MASYSEKDIRQAVDGMVDTASPEDFADDVESHVNIWVAERLQEEIDKIKANGGNAIPLAVKNCSIVKEDDAFLNRVEVNTGFDFGLIEQIMLSEPTNVTCKKGYKYVNVLLFKGNAPIPLILPYVYEHKKHKKNPLQDWVFINNSNQRTHHRVQGFS